MSAKEDRLREYPDRAEFAIEEEVNTSHQPLAVSHQESRLAITFSLDLSNSFRLQVDGG